jgi:hypothetical protein
MNTTVSTSVASVGLGGAATILLNWALSRWNVAMPDQVVAALTLVLTAAFHYASRFLPASESIAAAPKAEG